MLYPTFQFHDVPSADRFFISRPIPEEEGLALEKWEYFGGHIVTVHEAQGKIQTDYHVRDGRVYRRRKNGGFVVPHFVPLVPLKGEKQDTLTLSALGKSTVKGKNIGEPVSSKMGEEIINWIETAQIEKMDS